MTHPPSRSLPLDIPTARRHYVASTTTISMPVPPLSHSDYLTIKPILLASTTLTTMLSNIRTFSSTTPRLPSRYPCLLEPILPLSSPTPNLRQRTSMISPLIPSRTTTVRAPTLTAPASHPPLLLLHFPPPSTTTSISPSSLHPSKPTSLSDLLPVHLPPDRSAEARPVKQKGRL